MKRFRTGLFCSLFAAVLCVLAAPPAAAQCTAPVGQNSQTRYDYTTHKMYYCGNNVWREIPGGSSGASGAGCVVGTAYVPNSQSHTFYSATSHANCTTISQSRTCNNGTLSGSGTFQYASCANMGSCTQDGQSVIHGNAFTFFSSRYHANCASVSLSRTCNNGVLTGATSFQYSSCSIPSNCTLDGQTVNHGAAYTFFTAATHANCASISQSRTCTNGTLDGTALYNRANCSAPANCTLDGQTVNHGASHTFYTAATHANCSAISQSRTCNNGTLNGSATYSSATCAPPASPTCTFTVDTDIVPSTSTPDPWINVIHSGSQFIAGRLHSIFTSPDGETWTRTWSHSLGCIMISVAGANGRFALFDPCHGSKTSTNPTTWTTVSTFPSFQNAVPAAAFGSGTYVLTGGSIKTSTDWTNWTTNGTTGTFTGVIYAGSQFVAVGSNTAATSSNGTTWTVRTVPSGSWQSIAYGNGTYVAVATNKAMTSSNGVTWQERTTGTIGSGTWLSVAFGQGLFVAVSSNGKIVTSTDGAIWSDATVSDTGTWRTVVFGGGKFFVGASDSDKFALSSCSN